MKRVLLTGANGFIGRHCILPLLERGYEVYALFHSVIPVGLENNPNLHWCQVDFLDETRVTSLVLELRPSHLLHLAWYAVPGKYTDGLENLRWVAASLNLLQAFISAGGQRVTFTGTCAEYDWKYGYCSELITPANPTTLYGTCKYGLQLMFQALTSQIGLSAAWGRVFWLYGPVENPKRLISSVILALLQEEQARCSHGNQIRDFLHVEDVAAGLVALLDSDVQGTVNVGSGQPVAIKQVIYTIADYTGRPDLIQLGVLPTAIDEPALVVADVQRLTSEVGFRPKYNLKSGLIQTVEWWKTELKCSKLA